METNHAETDLRRYLLGELADEPAATLERDYFAREDLFDRVRVAESDLVDDYLTARLSQHERDRFEQHYLSTPVHRRRLAVARELRAAAEAAALVHAPTESTPWWTTAVHALRGSRRTLTPALAAAVMLVLVVGGGTWMLRSRSEAPAVVVTSPETTTPSKEGSPPSELVREQRPESERAPASPPAGPVTVALALSPFTVRGADETSVLRIPEGTELVVLHLEGDAAAPVIVGGRAVARTVSGKEIWRGSAAAARNAQSGTVARVEIPAATLRPDDYTIALFETDRNGRAVERYRYFLRVSGR
jgi:hypothetical protein